MNNVWCESCARKNNCYTSDIKPKCFVALTNSECITEPNDCSPFRFSENDWKEIFEWKEF